MSAPALVVRPVGRPARRRPRAAGLCPGTVFDGSRRSVGFEAHLISLGYSVPGAIRSVLLSHPRIAAGLRIQGPVLDLGCGTGLVAVAAGDLPAGPFTGVDLVRQDARARPREAALRRVAPGRRRQESLGLNWRLTATSADRSGEPRTNMHQRTEGRGALDRWLCPQPHDDEDALHLES